MPSSITGAPARTFTPEGRRFSYQRCEAMAKAFRPTMSFGRPGMGPCQGRFCGLTVSETIAEARKVPVAEVGYYRIRPPIKPVTLGELAAMAPAGEDPG